MLLGKYVTLRVIQSSDAEMVRAWKNSPDNYNYFANRDFITDVQQEIWVQSILNNSNCLYLIIVDNETKTSIGMTLLEDINLKNRNAVWGIYIASLNFRKKIYSVEASLLILNYAFNYLNLYKIYGNTLDCNTKGMKFHEFIGFEKEAIFEKHVFLDGKYSNLIWISLFTEYWPNKRTKLVKFISNFEEIV
jgi:RimJ/RimL family protein N-acetyltransferase